MQAGRRGLRPMMTDTDLILIWAAAFLVALLIELIKFRRAT